MKKVPTIIATLALIFAFILLGLYAYLSFWPFEPITFFPEQIPVLNKNHTLTHNEPIVTKFNFCVHNKVFSSSSRRFQQTDADQRVYFLADSPGAVTKIGCRTVTSATYKVPGDIPPGKYKILITITYTVNFLRSETQRLETEEFEVK